MVRVEVSSAGGHRSGRLERGNVADTKVRRRRLSPPTQPGRMRSPAQPIGGDERSTNMAPGADGRVLPTPAAVLAPPPSVDEIADRVLRIIERRARAQRERLGSA
jgi:hypothetical protein